MFQHKGFISGSFAAVFGKVVTMIAYNGKIIWQAINSCFGAGYWDNDKGWDNDDSWDNG